MPHLQPTSRISEGSTQPCRAGSPFRPIRVAVREEMVPVYSRQGPGWPARTLSLQGVGPKSTLSFRISSTRPG